MAPEMSSNVPFSGLKNEMNYSQFQFAAGRSTHNSRRLGRRSKSFDVSIPSKNILGVPIQCDISLYSIVHSILCDLVSDQMIPGIKDYFRMRPIQLPASTSVTILILIDGKVPVVPGIQITSM
jgi:hypothetical protein